MVCTIFIFAVFLWAPEYLCDLGLDLGDELNDRETKKLTNASEIPYLWLLEHNSDELPDRALGVGTRKNTCFTNPHTEIVLIFISF